MTELKVYRRHLQDNHVLYVLLSSLSLTCGGTIMQLVTVYCRESSSDSILNKRLALMLPRC